MPGNRKQQALSAAMVRTVNRPGMYADGNGLNLKVVSSGAKRWVQRVTIGGKRHNLGLGGYPAVSLAEARELAAENQRAIRQGRDPLAEKHQAEEDLRRPPVESGGSRPSHGRQHVCSSPARCRISTRRAFWRGPWQRPTAAAPEPRGFAPPGGNLPVLHPLAVPLQGDETADLRLGAAYSSPPVQFLPLV